MRFLFFMAFIAVILYIVSNFATQTNKLIKIKDHTYAHCADLGDIGNLGYKVIGNKIEGCKCSLGITSISPKWSCLEARRIKNG